MIVIVHVLVQPPWFRGKGVHLESGKPRFEPFLLVGLLSGQSIPVARPGGKGVCLESCTPRFEPCCHCGALVESKHTSGPVVKVSVLRAAPPGLSPFLFVGLLSGQSIPVAPW